MFSRKFKKISEENTNYAWMITLTKILIEIIPLNQDDKTGLLDRIKHNLVEESNPLLQTNNLKFGNKYINKLTFNLTNYFFILIIYICRFIT